MSATNSTDWIIGIGSPHGDDAVGWRAVERLVGQLPHDVRPIAIGEPLQMLQYLTGYGRLWIIDACRSGRLVGSVSRVIWPDERLIGQPRASTHAMSLPDTLRLAEALGTLPDSVVIYAIEIGTATQPGDVLSPAVAAALSDVQKLLLADVAARETGECTKTR